MGNPYFFLSKSLVISELALYPKEGKKLSFKKVPLYTIAEPEPSLGKPLYSHMIGYTKEDILVNNIFFLSLGLFAMLLFPCMEESDNFEVWHRCSRWMVVSLQRFKESGSSSQVCRH